MAHPRTRSRHLALGATAAALMFSVGCGSSDGPDLLLVANDPVDQELALMAATQGMDGDPRDGRSFPDPAAPLTQLGMRLFFSKSLSINRDTGCVSCHHPRLAGGDALTLPIGVEAVDQDLLGPGRAHQPTGHAFDGGPTVPRNSPTTFNLGLWRKVLFHDGRVESLMQPSPGNPEMIRTPDVPFGVVDVQAGETLAQAQARFPVTSPEEMKGHGSAGQSNQQIRDFLAQRLGGYGAGAGLLPNTAYWLQLFRAAFDDPTGTPQQLITYTNIAKALGDYQRSQVFVNTPWRRFLQGDTNAISAQAKRGALLFMRTPAQGGKDCASCHTGDFFSNEEFFPIGVPQLGHGKGNGPTGREDFGRARETGQANDMYAFRVPSLINVAVTGPWGHSGAYTTLANMIRHYRDPTQAAQNYDATQLTQPGIQNLATVAQDTAGAAAQILADRAAGRQAVPDLQLSEAEVADLEAFLGSLTDPCALDPACLAKWIPDPVVGADPNGDQVNARFTQ